jgi:hypothetical protein
MEIMCYQHRRLYKFCWLLFIISYFVSQQTPVRYGTSDNGFEKKQVVT